MELRVEDWRSYDKAVERALKRALSSVGKAMPKVADFWRSETDQQYPYIQSICFIFRDDQALSASRPVQQRALREALHASLIEAGFPRKFLYKVRVDFASKTAIKKAGGKFHYFYR